MAEVTFLSNWIVAKFILPFLLVFFILFAILEKTKVLGERHQLNAFVSFIVGLIFVGAIFPKEVVGNLILFLTVAMIVVFVTLLLWGFISGGDAKLEGWVKKLSGIVLIAAVIIAIFWAVGLRVEFLNNLVDFLFYSSWSGTFWTNVLFIGAIAIAIAVVLKTKGSSG
ncbi:hypothetical protein HYT25_03875 [Candidatus Pacearchaeota archaeon]|nr:hypothetical protein [Candidatus Pacearchaeota archaeon]